MKKTAITALLFLALIACQALEQLPLNLKSWSFVGGPGATTIKDGTVQLEQKESASKEFIAFSKSAAAGEGYYVLRGQFKGLSDGAAGVASLVGRTDSNGWIRDWRTPLLTATDWQDFELRLFVEDNCAFFQLQLEAHQGKVCFRHLTLEKTDPSEGVSTDAPDMEFWINMDFLDDIDYTYNIRHVERYDEKAIAEYFKLCRERGVTGVLWRISALGQMMHHTKVGVRYPALRTCALSKRDLATKSILDEFDPPVAAIREARRNGIKLYLWMTLCDESYTSDENEGGQINNSQFLLDNPTCELLDRKGNQLHGTICYNEPAARAYRLAVLKELLDYGADGIYLCNRTHSTVFGVDNDADYGFNPSVVAEYKKRYNVDILTEDYDPEKFKAIKAEGYNQLIKEASEMVHAAGQKLMLGVSFWGVSTGRVGANYGKMSVDIAGYLRNGWIDAIVSGQNNVGPYFAAAEIAAFRQNARPGQKFYYWAQMVDYAGGRVYPVEDLIKQAQFFNFYGANGAMYHESINFEEHDAPEKYFKPIAKFYEEH